MLFLFVISIIKPIGIKANTTSPDQITQTGSETNSISITWRDTAGANCYGLRIANNLNNLANANEIILNTNQSTIQNLTSASTYYVQIRSYNHSELSEWSTPAEVVTAPDKIEFLSQTEASSNGFTLQWSSIDNSVYDVYLSDNNTISNAVLYTQTNACSIALTNMNTNSAKYVFVIPCKISSTNYKASDPYSAAVLKCFTTPTEPTKYEVIGRDRSNQTKFACIPSTNQGNITGYELDIRNASNKRIKLVKANGSIDKGKAYKSIEYKNSKLYTDAFQFSFRSYLELPNGNKYYSNWTPLKRYIPGAYIKKSTFDQTSTCRLNWKKVTNAKSYTIYWSKDGVNWKTIAKNVTGTSAKVTYKKSAKRNYYYVRSNSVKFGKKNYSSPSPNKSADVWYFKS